MLPAAAASVKRSSVRISFRRKRPAPIERPEAAAYAPRVPNDPQPNLTKLSDLLGQERAIGAIQTALSSGRIPNGWLFAGPRGVGKMTAALAAAAAVNCGPAGGDDGGLFGGGGGGLFGGDPVPAKPSAATDADATCASCRKIAAGNHPDIRVVRVPPDKRIIPIESIRDVLNEFAFKPYEGKRRFVIVDGADLMSPQASNALLKTLEEPPPHSSWILVSEGTSRLLPTILSRCRIVRFGALPVDVAARLLAREAQLDMAEATGLAGLLGGSVGRALGEEAAHFRKDVREQVLDEAIDAITSSGTAKLLDVADGWDKRAKAEDLPVETVLEHLSSWLRDIAVWQTAKDPKRLLDPAHLDRVERIARKAKPAGVARAFDAVRLCVRDLQGNVNDKLSLETMLYALRRDLAA